MTHDPALLAERMRCFAHLLAGHDVNAPLPALVVPGYTPTHSKGTCESCGAATDTWRCSTCAEAIRLAILAWRDGRPAARPTGDLFTQVLP